MSVRFVREKGESDEKIYLSIGHGWYLKLVVGRSIVRDVTRSVEASEECICVVHRREVLLSRAFGRWVRTAFDRRLRLRGYDGRLGCRERRGRGSKVGFEGEQRFG